jgi:hypothetical protein
MPDKTDFSLVLKTKLDVSLGISLGLSKLQDRFETGLVRKPIFRCVFEIQI